MCHITTSPTKAPRPKWGVLYALVGVGLALFTVVDILSPPVGWRTLMDCVLSLVVFGTMAAWVRWNRVALAQADWCDCAAEQGAGRVFHSHPMARPVAQPTKRVPLRVHQGDLGKVDPMEGEELECSVTSDHP